MIPALSATISGAIADFGIFAEGVPTLTTRMLVERRLIVRFLHWHRHFDDTVGENMRLVRRSIRATSGGGEHSFCPPANAWIERFLVARAVRAEMRVLYFAHGHHTNYIITP